MKLRIALTALLAAHLAGCAGPKTRQVSGPVAAATFFGHELFLGGSSRSLLKLGQKLDISRWKFDEAAEQTIRDGLAAREREYRSLELGPEELSHAQNLRESRWQKTAGRYSQATLDLLFRRAREKGVKQLLTIFPLESLDGFATKRGPIGVDCTEGDAGRAYVYFMADVAIWDVDSQRKTFDITLPPNATTGVSFADCAAASQATNPLDQFEDPAKKTFARVMDVLLDELGWRKAQ